MRVLSSGSHTTPTIGHDARTVPTLLKALLTLAVLLPAGGLVAGMLAADDTSGSPRETIVISRKADRGATTGPATVTVTGTEVRPGRRFVPEPPPAPDPTPRPPVVEDDDDPEPVVPAPVAVDDDDDDDDDGGDDDDD